MAVADELKIILRAETKSAVNALRKAQRETDSTEAQFKKLASGLGKSMLAWGAAAVSVRAFTKTIQDSIRLYQIQEDAERGLRSALIATGQDASSAGIAIRQLASELQGLTTYGDEASIQAATLLTQLGGISSVGMEQALPAVQDLASALGMDLQTAASLVGRTIGSTTNSLSRYGLQIDNSLTGTERFNAVIGEIEEKFGGFSQDLAQTSSGSLQQLSNAFGDLKETGGSMLTTFLRPATTAMTNYIIRMNEAITSKRTLNQLEGVNTIAAAQERILALETQREHIAADIAKDEEEIAETRATMQRNERIGNDQITQASRDALELRVAQRNELINQRMEINRNIAAERQLIDEIREREGVEDPAPLGPLVSDPGEVAATGEAAGGMLYEAIAQGYRRAFQGAGGYLGNEFTGVLETVEETGRSIEDTLGEIESAWGKLSMLGNQAINTWSTYDSYLAAFEQRRIDAITRENELRQFQWDMALEKARSEGASESELARLKMEIAQEEWEMKQAQEEKIASLQRRQARRQKAIDIANSIMGTASAVVAALGMRPWSPANYALAGIVGSLGAAQTGLIASTPIPAFANGGDFMTNGPQMIMVGDNPGGRERVRIDPQPDGRGGSGTVNIYISGAIGGREEVAVWVDEGLRRARARGLVA